MSKSSDSLCMAVPEAVARISQNEAKQLEFIGDKIPGRLRLFVRKGGQFLPSALVKFLTSCDPQIVLSYLEKGYVLGEEAVSAVLARKDDELAKAMMEAKSWCPFPFGGYHPMPVAHMCSDEV